MAHAVVNHFEAVKVQKQNREQRVFAAFRMFNEAPEPVDKKQPVWKARKRVGYFSLRDVRLRAGHS
jgi:hypothetical protein